MTNTATNNKNHFSTYKQCEDIANELEDLKESLQDDIIDNSEVLTKLDEIQSAIDSINGVKNPASISVTNCSLNSTNSNSAQEVDIINITGSGKLCFADMELNVGYTSGRFRGATLSVYVDDEKIFDCRYLCTYNTSDSDILVNRHILICPYHYLIDDEYPSNSSYLALKLNPVFYSSSWVNRVDCVVKLNLGSNSYESRTAANQEYLYLCSLLEEIPFKTSLRVTAKSETSITGTPTGNITTYVGYTID